MRVVHIETMLVTRFAVVDDEDNSLDIKEASKTIKKLKKAEFEHAFEELMEGKAKILEEYNPPKEAS